MRVAILGYGTEGRSAAAYWKAKGDQITICDINETLQIGEGYATKLGQYYLSNLDGFDLIVRSPGIHPQEIVTTRPVTSVIREFMAKCPATVIGVTGTKGKGTTSTLISKILEEAGCRVWLGGNIGSSPLDFLAQVRATDYVVLELSSFQLIDLDKSPHVAVCIMIAPDHQDWHASLDEYLQAKAQIFLNQTTDDLAVYKADDPRSRQIGELSYGRHLPYFGKPGAMIVHDEVVIDGHKICDVADVGLVGAHNLENVCAAVTATWDIVDHKVKPIKDAVTSFTGLEHRLELVGEANGVRYYDDSFATTPETAIAAINAFNMPKVIILGGSDKGAQFDTVAAAVRDGNVKHAILIGDTAPALLAALSGVGFSKFTSGLTTMPLIVAAAAEVAVKGDVVLLSPACASFGLFDNYKDRGDKFELAVQSL